MAETSSQRCHLARRRADAGAFDDGGTLARREQAHGLEHEALLVADLEDEIELECEAGERAGFVAGEREGGFSTTGVLAGLERHARELGAWMTAGVAKTSARTQRGNAPSKEPNTRPLPILPISLPALFGVEGQHADELGVRRSRSISGPDSRRTHQRRSRRCGPCRYGCRVLWPF